MLECRRKLFVDGRVKFTTVPFRPLTDQGCQSCRYFFPPKNSDNFVWNWVIACAANSNLQIPKSLQPDVFHL